MSAEMLKQTYPVLKYFEYVDPLRSVSREFAELAIKMAEQFPEGKPEVSAGLRKLLEAKDCFVRAKL